MAARPQSVRLHVAVCLFERGTFLFTATPQTRKDFLPRQSLEWFRDRTIGALRAERHTLTSAEWTPCSACHEFLCSRSFFFVLRSALRPQIPRFFCKFTMNLANAPPPPESLRTCFVCATHAHSHFCPQHWLLCHLGLYVCICSSSSSSLSSWSVGKYA